MTDEQEPSKFWGRRASELPVPPPPTWLAVGYVPNAEITVLVGEEGIGKSLTWVVLAMHITTGIPLPELNLPARKPADVVLILTEDSWSEVRARLLAAGADLERVHVFSEDEDGSSSPVFPAQQQVLLRWAEEEAIRPALIVVDAWLDTVPSNIAVRDTQSGRAALAPWKTIAGKLESAVLLVTHTNRLGTGNTRDLMGSTVSLRQKARMVLFAAREPGDGVDGAPQHALDRAGEGQYDRRSTWSRFEISIEQARARTVDDPGTVAMLVTPEDAGATIRDLVSEWKRDADADTAPAKESASERAEHFVLTYMARRGVNTVLSSEIKTAAHIAGIGERAAKVAMSLLGESKPIGPGQPWYYRLHQSVQAGSMLPDSAPTDHTAQTAQTDVGQLVQTLQSGQPGEARRPAANTAGVTS